MELSQSVHSRHARSLSTHDTHDHCPNFSDIHKNKKKKNHLEWVVHVVLGRIYPAITGDNDATVWSPVPVQCWLANGVLRSRRLVFVDVYSLWSILSKQSREAPDGEHSRISQNIRWKINSEVYFPCYWLIHHSFPQRLKVNTFQYKTVCITFDS